MERCDGKTQDMLAAEKGGRRAEMKGKTGRELWASGVCDAVWPIPRSSSGNALIEQTQDCSAETPAREQRGGEALNCPVPKRGDNNEHTPDQGCGHKEKSGLL